MISLLLSVATSAEDRKDETMIWGFFLSLSAGTWANESCFNPDGNVSFFDSDVYLKYNFSEKDTITPVESYWK